MSEFGMLMFCSRFQHPFIFKLESSLSSFAWDVLSGISCQFKDPFFVISFSFYRSAIFWTKSVILIFMLMKLLVTLNVVKSLLLWLLLRQLTCSMILLYFEVMLNLYKPTILNCAVDRCLVTATSPNAPNCILDIF